MVLLSVHRQPPVYHRQFDFLFVQHRLDSRLLSYQLTVFFPQSLANSVLFPISDVSTASLTTLKLAFMFHTVGRVIDHLYNMMYVSAPLRETNPYFIQRNHISFITRYNICPVSSLHIRYSQASLELIFRSVIEQMLTRNL